MPDLKCCFTKFTECTTVFGADMYYGGDSSSTLQTLSYTCSYCGQMGFSISLLLEHIRASHGANSGTPATEVVGVFVVLCN